MEGRNREPPLSYARSVCAPPEPGVQPRSELAILNHTTVSRPLSCQTSKAIVLKGGSRDDKKIARQTNYHFISSLKKF